MSTVIRTVVLTFRVSKEFASATDV
jgi:hypothetical protein